jgi:tetratricopeptide (TPR) repeat protein
MRGIALRLTLVCAACAAPSDEPDAPGRLESLRAQIHARALESDPEQGLVLIDEALTLAPHDAWLWYKRGVAMDLMGDLEQAVQALDAALRYDPTHVKSLEWRAHVALAQRRPAEALADLERALELLPTTDPAGVPEGLATLERALRIQQARALDALGRHAEANAVRDAL